MLKRAAYATEDTLRPTAGSTRPAAPNRHTVLLVGALAAVLLIRAVWVPSTLLQPDEAYYWDWSRRLDLGYFDHPPLVAVMIRLTTLLGGTGEAAVRSGAVALGLVTVALIYCAGTLQGGRRAGWWGLGLAAVCPLFVLPSTFVAPDGPAMCLWAAVVYALLRGVRAGQQRWWYVAGVALGLAVQAKYSSLLLVPAIAAWILLGPGRWYRRREPYGAAGLALLVAGPNLWWNLQHGWISVVFQAAHGACLAALPSAGPWAEGGVYVATQANLLSPPLALLLAVGTAAALADGLRRDEAALLLACLTVLPGAVLLLLHGARHWAEPTYVPATVATGLWLARTLRGPRLPVRRVLAVLAILALALAALESAALEGVYLAHAGRSPHAAWAAPRAVDPLVTRIIPSLAAPQPFWPDLGQAVAAAIAERRATKLSPAVWADTYGTAAEVAFYTPGHPRVYSGSNQYSLWGAPAGAGKAPLVVGRRGALQALGVSAEAGARSTVLVPVPPPGRAADGLQVVALAPLRGQAARTRAARLMDETSFRHWRPQTCLPAMQGG